MKIEAVHIKNYKSLRDVSLKELGNLVILIGANSSGKSNFLEILNRFFAEIDLTGTPTGIDTYSWFDRNVDEPIEVSMTLKLDDKDCNEIFPPEILKIVKERFGERYQELSVLDSETQLTLRDLGISEERPKQKRWSRIEKIFKELTKQRLGSHPTHPYLRVMEEDLALPIQYRGGGEQELLFLLRFLTEDRQIFGIEEPELHTHPQLARQIFHLFKDFSKEKQIFIATHSTAFVDQADIDTTWIVRKEGKETIITRIKKPEELRNLLFELGVKPSDIFFSEAVIFVEGESERIVYPILAEKLDVNLRSPRISIIPTRGKNRGKYYLNVWIEASKSANIPYFMIFDREAGEDKEIKEFVGKKFLVENENLFILKKGSIEDYYPRDKLIEAIQSEYQMELSEKDKEDILRIPRARNIETLLEEKGKEVRGWKVRVGKKVAESMRADEIDDEIKRIMERLRTKLGT